MSKDDNPNELRARQLRFLAALHRKRAAELDMAAAAYVAAGSMQRFVEVITESEARELAAHPDLAELNVQLEGFYGADTAHPDEGQPS
ncbi:hypothetical protein ACWGLE_01145 [Streptomyces sp. NPDC055897]